MPAFPAQARRTGRYLERLYPQRAAVFRLRRTSDAGELDCRAEMQVAETLKTSCTISCTTIRRYRSCCCASFVALRGCCFGPTGFRIAVECCEACCSAADSDCRGGVSASNRSKRTHGNEAIIGWADGCQRFGQQEAAVSTISAQRAFQSAGHAATRLQMLCMPVRRPDIMVVCCIHMKPTCTATRCSGRASSGLTTADNACSSKHAGQLPD